METMDYDPVTDLMWGIGLELSDNTYRRTVVALDSKSGNFTTYYYIPDYFIIEGGEGAINYNNHTYYGVLQKDGPVDKTPYDLVAIDMASGQIYSHPNLCDAGQICLWSLEFSNSYIE